MVYSEKYIGDIFTSSPVILIESTFFQLSLAFTPIPFGVFIPVVSGWAIGTLTHYTRADMVSQFMDIKWISHYFTNQLIVLAIFK